VLTKPRPKVIKVIFNDQEWEIIEQHFKFHIIKSQNRHLVMGEAE